MTTLPTPTNGMPIDSDYIFTIVTELNRLSKLLGASSVTSQINNNIDQTVTPHTSDVKIYAETVQITKAGFSVSPKYEATRTITFATPFKYKPIVTATVVSNDNTTTGKTANVALTNVSAKSVTIVVEFGSDKGTANVDVNVIAVGIPIATSN